MNITGAMPKEVNCKSIFAPETSKGTARNNADAASVMLCEMDNGALFRVTGCAAFGGHGNWYRIACLNGTAETVRGNQDNIKLSYNSWSKPEGADDNSFYKAEWTQNAELADKAGHGGGDFWVIYHFVKYLTDNIRPFFDVYRSTAMASVGILAWRSALNNGIPFKIPDFKNEAERKNYENDSLSPFPDKNGSVTLPCAIKPYKPDDDDIKAAEKVWRDNGIIL
jgi:hypothetical protein